MRDSPVSNVHVHVIGFVCFVVAFFAHIRFRQHKIVNFRQAFRFHSWYRISMTRLKKFATHRMFCCARCTNAFNDLKVFCQRLIHRSRCFTSIEMCDWFFYTISLPFRYERRYGPDSFVSNLSGPLKSTTYNGLESYNPNKYLGKCETQHGTSKNSNRTQTEHENNLLLFFLGGTKCVKTRQK